MKVMRSPDSAFDLRAALVEEVQTAVEIFESDPTAPKTIHRSRVALKRARTLAAVGSVGAPGLADVFDNGARAIMRAFAISRDNWTLERTARAMSRKVSKKARRELRDLADRAEAFQRTATPLNIEATRAGLKDLLAIAQVWPEATARQVERGVRQVVRRARRTWRRARHDDTHGRHAWRKHEKARLYAASLLSDAWPRNRRRRRKRNAQLAERLGDERDLTLLMARLTADHPVNGGPHALRDLRRIRKRLRRRIKKLGRQLHADGA